MPRDSVAHTLKVAVLLCLICSLVVSAAAVGLRERQEANKLREMRRNVLEAAGIWDPQQHTGADVNRLFESVERRLVELDTGEYVASLEVPGEYDPRSAIRDPEFSRRIPAGEDIAGVKRREDYAYVYLVKSEAGEVEQVVLPIRGYGLWSTLWGFLAIDAQSLAEGPGQTRVRGITYYEHAETPGLGGEVDNPRWKSLWEGKRLFDGQWDVIINVVKGADSAFEVEALSGATITSRGVSNMLKYWLGDDGFGPYLKNLREQLTGQSPEGGENG